MKKYILFRLLRAVLSIVIVTTIVYALIYTLIPRRQVFVSDENYSKMTGTPEKKVTYENSILERLGYIDYYYGRELVDEVSKEDKTFTAVGNKDNLAAAKAWAKKTGKGWQIDQTPESHTLYATREIPIAERVLRFYSQLIQIDHPWKVQDKTNPDLKRSLKLTWVDGSGPALVGSGTQYKYQIWTDGKFPFIHQHIVTLNLGVSYPTFGGIGVTDVLTGGQGETKTQAVVLDDGKHFNTSMDLFSAQYQTPKDHSERNKKIFSDDYQKTQNNYTDPSMISNSFKIGAIGVILAYIMAVPIGIWLSRKSGTIFDRFGLSFLTLFIALPSLATIYFDRLIGSSLFGLPDNFTTYGAQDFRSYVLPTIIIALLTVPSLAIWVRRYMIDQQLSDYVKFARAKGLSEREISTNHILRNAMIPLSNGIPTAIIATIGGATITESIFLVPGMGKMLPDAIKAHNNPMVIGITFILTTVSVVAVLLGDLLMQKIDPRINLTSKGGK